MNPSIRSTTPARTVLVLGAGGRLGATAVRAFAEAGWRVLAQQRRAPQQLPAGAVHLATPLHDTATLAQQAAGAQAVVYAINPPYTEWATQMLPLARQGMDLAERLNALFMLPGNVYAFGENMPALLDEHTPERPSTEKGQLRAGLEAELRQRAGNGRLHGAFHGEKVIVVDANGRRQVRAVRAVTGIDQDVKLNRALWTLAEEMRRLKA